MRIILNCSVILIKLIAWTMCGTVVSRTRGDDSKVEVDFADCVDPEKGGRLLLDNRKEHCSMACMNDRGIVLAAKSAPERSRPRSTIFFQPFVSWTDNAHWGKAMPAGEEVEGTAIVFFFNSKNLL